MRGWSVANYVAFGVFALVLILFFVSGVVKATLKPDESELKETLDDLWWAVSTPAKVIARRHRHSLRAPGGDGTNESLLRRPVGLLLKGKRRYVIGATLALFAAVFALTLVVGQGEGEILLLYGLPIFVVALQWGAIAGLAAAGIAGGLAALEAVIDEATVSAVAYVGLGVVFVVGGLGGLFRDKPLGAWLGVSIRDWYRRPRTPPEEYDPADPWWKQPAGWLLEGHRKTVTVVAALLLAGIFWLGLMVDDGSGVPLLYTLPVALAAVLSGVYAGLAVAALAAALGAVAGATNGAPISEAGYATYAGLFAVVAFFNGYFRDKPLRVLPLYSVLLPIGLGAILFNALLGALGSLTSASAYDEPPPSPQAVMVYDASQDREAASLTDAVLFALAGDPPSSYQLSDVDPDDEGRCRAALAELQAYVSEANAKQDEAGDTASELESAVRAGDIRASTVVAVVDAYDNPAQAIRGLHGAYLSQFARLTQEADSLEPVADGVEAIFEELIKRRKEKQELEARRAQRRAVE